MWQGGTHEVGGFLITRQTLANFSSHGMCLLKEKSNSKRTESARNDL